MNIKKFFTVISIAVLLAACTTPETIETSSYTVDMPVGYNTIENNLNLDGFIDYTLMTGKKSAMTVMAFPAGPDPEKFLYSQTYGGNNVELSECEFGDITQEEIAGKNLYRVDADGYVAGKKVAGAIYTFEGGNNLFLFMALGFNGEPPVAKDVIASIEPKPETRSEHERNAAYIDGVIEFSKATLPRDVDEFTTWLDVEADTTRKCIVMNMEIVGSADDYDIDAFRAALEVQARQAISIINESRSADYLIDIPTRQGYDFEYVYTTADDNIELGRMFIPNDSIRD